MRLPSQKSGFEPVILVFSDCVGERVFRRCCVGRIFKFLVKMNRDVFVSSKVKGGRGEIHCVNIQIGKKRACIRKSLVNT